MRLKCLAGAYAGQVRDYSTPVGLAALRSGTAERLDAPVRRVPTTAVSAVAAKSDSTKKRKH